MSSAQLSGPPPGKRRKGVDPSSSNQGNYPGYYPSNPGPGGYGGYYSQQPPPPPPPPQSQGYHRNNWSSSSSSGPYNNNNSSNSSSNGQWKGQQQQPPPLPPPQQQPPQPPPHSRSGYRGPPPQATPDRYPPMSSIPPRHSSTSPSRSNGGGNNHNKNMSSPTPSSSSGQPWGPTNNWRNQPPPPPPSTYYNNNPDTRGSPPRSMRPMPTDMPPMCQPEGTMVNMMNEGTRNVMMMNNHPNGFDPSRGGDKGRGSYRCGKCGVPKKGHVCPYQPKLKRRSDEPPPEMKCASTQVEMDEFLVMRRLNLEIQGFPCSYAEVPDMVGTETKQEESKNSPIGVTPTRQ